MWDEEQSHSMVYEASLLICTLSHHPHCYISKDMASMTAADYENYVGDHLRYFARRNGIVCPEHERTKPAVIRKLITEVSFTQQQFDDFWARVDVQNDLKNPRNPKKPKRPSRGKKQANTRYGNEEDDNEEKEGEEEQDEHENPPPVPSRSSLRPTAPAQQAPTQTLLQVPDQSKVHGFMTRTQIDRYVTPHLLEGMGYLATIEPEKPLKWLSVFLRKRSETIGEGEEPFEESEMGASGSAQQGMVTPSADISEGSGKGRALGEED
jgi:hypothetical protein